MHSRTLNVLAWPEPGYEPSAAPRHWPQLVFAREDSVGSDERIEPPARILVVEDDFLVAAEIEIALSDAGFDVAGVATAFMRQWRFSASSGFAASSRPRFTTNIRLSALSRQCRLAGYKSPIPWPRWWTRSAAP